MKKFRFDIEEKALYYGVENDYTSGQTATVNTVLKQAKNSQRYRKDIYDFLNAYPSKDIATLPKDLIKQCLQSSKNECKIIKLFTFSNFSLDGIPFQADSSFAMYVKEEINPYKKGSKEINPHLGRQKLHYPTTMSYEEYNINNKRVLNKILEVNGGFAYVVKGFDIDIETKTLNFRTTMVGPKGVLLSNVFRRQKGTGKKLLVDGIVFDNHYGSNIYNYNIEKIISPEENQAFFATLNKIQKSCRENGEIGEKYVFDNLKDILAKEYTDPKHVSKEFPQAPYDIECLVNGQRFFIEVKSTAHKKKEFYMSRGERLFMDKYDEHYILVLVTNVKSQQRKYFKYHRDDIMNDSTMDKETQSIKFIVK